jgi:hypothetical protein
MVHGERPAHAGRYFAFDPVLFNPPKFRVSHRASRQHAVDSIILTTQ